MPSLQPLKEHVKVYLDTEEERKGERGKIWALPDPQTKTNKQTNPETATHNNSKTQSRPSESIGSDLAPESAELVKDVDRAEDTRGRPGAWAWGAARVQARWRWQVDGDARGACSQVPSGTEFPSRMPLT